ERLRHDVQLRAGTRDHRRDGHLLDSCDCSFRDDRPENLDGVRVSAWLTSEAPMVLSPWGLTPNRVYAETRRVNGTCTSSRPVPSRGGPAAIPPRRCVAGPGQATAGTAAATHPLPAAPSPG